jgi:peptide/nickel transport system permease protein
MTWFVLRRLGIFLLTLFVASIAIFLVISILPGDPAQAILGTQATPESLEALRRELGLDAPLWSRYLRWIGGAVTGDLGTSVISKVPVAPEIADRLLVTVPLAALGMAIALGAALPLGLLAAARHRRLEGTAVALLSQLGIAVPAFWVGILLITLFAVRLGWLPSGGFVPWQESVGGAIRSLILPACSLALVQGAILTRYVRSAVLEVMREDFIRTARAKGLSARRTLWRHALPNAAIPVVTILGLQFAYLLAGAVVIENVFFLPGLGRMVLQAIGNSDLVAVQAITLTLTAIVLAVNFLTDVSYRFLDPRLRTES